MPSGSHFRRYTFRCPRCKRFETCVIQSRPLKGAQRLRVIRCKRKDCRHVWSKVSAALPARTRALRVAARNAETP